MTKRLCIEPTPAAADAFWDYWDANEDKHGVYETTWGAINAAIKASGIVEHVHDPEIELESCTICGQLTPNVFGINFKAIPVCETCADSISLQQVNYVIQNK